MTAQNNVAARDSNTQKHLVVAGREFVLVGTAHVSKESMEEVELAVEKENPDSVAIELDQKRLASIEDPEAWRKMDIIKVLKNKQGFLMLSNLILSAYQKRMGQGTGVKPGQEMIAAINKAKSLDIPQYMVDRPIAVTMRRAWAKNSFWGKCKLLGVLIASAFAKEEAAPDEIENLKKTNEMDAMMGEVAEYFPKVKEVLIDERDRYLASHIWQCPGNKVLAVLGAGHLKGVQKHISDIAAGTESPDCSDISEVPPKSLASKIAMWIIPLLIIAVIAAGFVIGGRKKGFDMLSAWVWWNAALAGIGALIAGAHPITILVSAIGAPLTSLCPFIGIGIVAGIVQALICKPKVQDMETMQQDATSIKGFYKNRLLRVLLVFILSSLGSTLGTFLAGANIVKIIASFFDKVVDLVKGLFGI